MSVDWSPLTAELAIWRREALHLPLWWRDDDAVAATSALDRLTALSLDAGLPVHIAVIPDLVEPSLLPVVADAPTLIPVVHGWRHTNHAPDGAKKAEFGHVRAGTDAELHAGLNRLSEHFGTRLLPIFVPPWNRLDETNLPALAAAGYAAVSTFGPRKKNFAARGVRQINTHIDPVFWRGDRGLVPPEILIEGITTTLRDRRKGRTDATEPLGLLTHHLVHTEAVWNFSGNLLRVLLDGGAVPADLRDTLRGP